MQALLKKIKHCTICASQFSHSPNPVLAAHKNSKILLIGQAPGIRVHESGILWNDASGKNLRKWLQMDHDTFYNPENLAVMPMGFCYPGKGRTGDLPPRPECAPEWHNQILPKFESLQLTLLVGKYAQNYYLKERAKRTLTETVKSFKEYLPSFFPLPHPSPRNNIWMKKNTWFQEEVLPTLQEKIIDILNK